MSDKSDKYVRAITVDFKSLLVLKGENAKFVETASEVLLNYFLSKNKSASDSNLVAFYEKNCTKKKKKIEYDPEFLFKFKHINHKLDINTQNLIKLLQIRRDDCLLVEENNLEDRELKNANSSSSSFYYRPNSRINRQDRSSLKSAQELDSTKQNNISPRSKTSNEINQELDDSSDLANLNNSHNPPNNFDNGIKREKNDFNDSFRFNVHCKEFVPISDPEVINKVSESKNDDQVYYEDKNQNSANIEDITLKHCKEDSRTSFYIKSNASNNFDETESTDHGTTGLDKLNKLDEDARTNIYESRRSNVYNEETKPADLNENVESNFRNRETKLTRLYSSNESCNKDLKSNDCNEETRSNGCKRDSNKNTDDDKDASNSKTSLGSTSKVYKRGINQFKISFDFRDL